MIGDRLVLIDEVHTPDSSRYWVGKPTLPQWLKDARSSLTKSIAPLAQRERVWRGQSTDSNR